MRFYAPTQYPQCFRKIAWRLRHSAPVGLQGFQVIFRHADVEAPPVDHQPQEAILAPQPIKEDALLTGPLEPTNEWYAVAKIAGIKMCQAYARQYGFAAISLMPTNLYGPNDNFDLETSHVLPALLRKFHEARVEGRPSVTLWGTGTPRREFLHVDDLADAALWLMEHYDSPELVNVGVGEDISISELAELIRSIVGFEGAIEYDRTKPDGTPRKLLDVSKLHALGWRHRIGLREGIESTYAWYLENVANAARRSGA